MNERDALLRAVLEDPAEDTVRLVFADHLAENGESDRAEFIRVQCGLARTPEPEHKTIGPVGRGDHADRRWGRCAECARLPHPCPYHMRERRRDELFSRACRDEGRGLGIEHWFRLFGGWSCDENDEPLRRDSTHSWAVLDRGFICEVRLPAAAFAESVARELFVRHPITRVVLTDREPVELSPHWRTEPWTFPVSDNCRSDHRNAIPWAIFDAMGNREWFPTRDAVLAAWSDGCVAWGRSLAGLSHIDTNSSRTDTHFAASE